MGHRRRVAAKRLDRATRWRRRTGSTRWPYASSNGEKLRVIGSIQSVLVAPQDPAALLDALTDPGIRIVTLTITEKAYLRNAAGDLDATHPDIVGDLATPGKPQTAHGFLAEALARRRAAGTAPFTVLCCDNLPANGATLQRLLVQFAALRDPALPATWPKRSPSRRAWSTASCRRRPMPTARVSAALGVEDAWPVMTEPFRQWVVEDKFPAGRPAWEKFGVTMVRDVRPFEEMKLRLLNGAHSSIAYLGLLAGHETVAEAFADPAIRRFVDALWAEAIPTLPKDAGLDPRPTSRHWPTASPTRRLPTAPRRSPMTAARSCRSASSPRHSTGWRRAPPPTT